MKFELFIFLLTVVGTNGWRGGFSRPMPSTAGHSLVHRRSGSSTSTNPSNGHHHHHQQQPHSESPFTFASLAGSYHHSHHHHMMQSSSWQSSTKTSLFGTAALMDDETASVTSVASGTGDDTHIHSAPVHEAGVGQGEGEGVEGNMMQYSAHEDQHSADGMDIEGAAEYEMNQGGINQYGDIAKTPTLSPASQALFEKMVSILQSQLPLEQREMYERHRNNSNSNSSNSNSDNTTASDPTHAPTTTTSATATTVSANAALMSSSNGKASQQSPTPSTSASPSPASPALTHIAGLPIQSLPSPTPNVLAHAHYLHNLFEALVECATTHSVTEAERAWNRLFMEKSLFPITVLQDIAQYLMIRNDFIARSGLRNPDLLCEVLNSKIVLSELLIKLRLHDLFFDCVSLFHSVDRYRIAVGASPYFKPYEGEDPLQTSQQLTTFGLSAVMTGAIVQADYNFVLNLIKSQTKGISKAMFSLYHAFRKNLPKKSMFFQTLPAFVSLLKQTYALLLERKVVIGKSILQNYLELMCQFGSEKDFSETLKWLDDHSVPTDTRTFNILLNRATRKNDMKWADDLFRRMITNRMKPSGDVVRNLVNLYIRNQHGMGIEELAKYINAYDLNCPTAAATAIKSFIDSVDPFHNTRRLLRARLGSGPFRQQAPRMSPPFPSNPSSTRPVPVNRGASAVPHTAPVASVSIARPPMNP